MALGTISFICETHGTISRTGMADIPFLTSELIGCTVADLISQWTLDTSGKHLTTPALAKVSFFVKHFESASDAPFRPDSAVNIRLLEDQTVQV